jgi:hypothetical protein
MTMLDKANDGRRWLCPWCGQQATLKTECRVICYSKTCTCGAIALGAPPWDFDEIVDDAIGIFEVEIRPESRGFDSRLLDDVQRSGVEMRMGALVRPDEGPPLEYQYIWFRKPEASRLAALRSLPAPSKTFLLGHDGFGPRVG